MSKHPSLRPMKLMLTLILGCFSFSVAQAGVGFSAGSRFLATPIQGQVIVYCSGAETPTVTYLCRDVVLDPTSYDYFEGSAMDADTVHLSCLRPDGTRRDKGMDYRNGRSAEPYNLWVSTLFQKPLLQAGLNKIDYKLTRRGNVLEQGSFEVQVDRGQARTCPDTHYNTTNPADCTSQYSVCQRYFEQYDYCR